MAIICKVERKRGETCCSRERETNLKLDFPASAGNLRLKFQASSLTQCGQIISRYLLLVSHILRNSTRIYDTIGRTSRDDMNDLDVNSLIWRVLMSAMFGCSSSSWTRLFGEFTFYQKSDTTNVETIVRRITEVDHRSNRDSRNIRDWLAHTPLAMDNFVDRHSSPVNDSKSLCILRFSIESRPNESTSRVHGRMEK